MVDFRWFDVSRRYDSPNDDCDHASVEFFDGHSTSSSQLGNTLCGTDRPSLILSSGSSLTMRLQASGDFSVMDFRAIYTVFSDDTSCSSFTCTTTSRCIDSTVTCDNQGYGNCGEEDFSDQEDADCPVVYTTPDLRPLLYAALVLLLPFLFLLYFCCWRPGYMVWACGCWRRQSCRDCGCCCPVQSRGLCRRICTCDRRATKSNSVGNLREDGRMRREKAL
ncbi:low-density lipoprotein receptor class A domain-containing protein 2-like [Strongylocentrotus purpuratus]|uniref:CUB domain-containing protein n=1 Tax=Strongylocentrotus purpuratus TaxID=7668 RepID=A0A7M7NRJ8_STRPU|nr:low-density lipoprotein receptor class A domain-containing protein 2-like [Strongylocentrotus purpuratus]